MCLFCLSAACRKALGYLTSCNQGEREAHAMPSIVPAIEVARVQLHAPMSRHVRRAWRLTSLRQHNVAEDLGGPAKDTVCCTEHPRREETTVHGAAPARRQ